jgi:ABC-type antimicrobial peptide transport system permease subunit
MVLSAFGLIACVIACVGLYGSLAFLVRARSRELGVRLALGAHGGQLRGSVIRHGLLLCAAGITLGLSAATLGAQSLASLTFGVASLDAATCLFASSAMLLVALIACWIPAQCAARINPMEILRE